MYFANDSIDKLWQATHFWKLRYFFHVMCHVYTVVHMTKTTLKFSKCCLLSVKRHLRFLPLMIKSPISWATKLERFVKKVVLEWVPWYTRSQLVIFENQTVRKMCMCVYVWLCLCLQVLVCDWMCVSFGTSLCTFWRIVYTVWCVFSVSASEEKRTNIFRYSSPFLMVFILQFQYSNHFH